MIKYALCTFSVSGTTIYHTTTETLKQKIYVLVRSRVVYLRFQFMTKTRATDSSVDSVYFPETNRDVLTVVGILAQYQNDPIKRVYSRAKCAHSEADRIGYDRYKHNTVNMIL